jgi:hypothetical protein
MTRGDPWHRRGTGVVGEGCRVGPHRCERRVSRGRAGVPGTSSSARWGRSRRLFAAAPG